MTKDRLCSKLAYELSSKGYISLITDYLKRHNLDELISYEPLINQYIHNHVPLVKQEAERQVIHNQFKESPKSVIQDLLNKLNQQPPPQQTTKNSKEPNKKTVFDSNQVYDYYKGCQNFSRDIVSVAHNHEGLMYYIQTYNDCLYDVIGCSYKNPTTDYPHDEIFINTLSWPERLEKLPFRTKVKLSNDSGSVLNEITGNYDIAVSYLDKSSGYVTKRIYKKRQNNFNSKK